MAFVSCQEGATQLPVECDDRITYATVAEPFLRNYCTGCHASKLELGNRFGAPVSVNLDTYADAKQWAVRSYVRAVHFQTMPPSGGYRTLNVNDLSSGHCAVRMGPKPVHRN